MQISKLSKKERQGAKYTLSKEEMREKLSITKEDKGFRIIIPKTYRYGKQALKKLDVNEFANHYNSYRIEIKDIIKLIKQQEGLSESETLSKEQVGAFLKKNLSKLLKQEEISSIKKDGTVTEAI